MLESNNSGYRGTPGSWLRRLYCLYERIEQLLPLLRRMGDTWYMAFRKNPTPDSSSKEAVRP
jgi:hypothetical protein